MTLHRDYSLIIEEVLYIWLWFLCRDITAELQNELNLHRIQSLIIVEVLYIWLWFLCRDITAE